MRTQAHTEIGITVGLIDAMLTIAKVLAPRVKDEPGGTVREALRDLHSHPDMIDILTSGPYNPYIMKDGPEIREAVERAIAPYRKGSKEGKILHVWQTGPIL